MLRSTGQRNCWNERRNATLPWTLWVRVATTARERVCVVWHGGHHLSCAVATKTIKICQVQPNEFLWSSGAQTDLSGSVTG